MWQQLCVYAIHYTDTYMYNMVYAVCCDATNGGISRQTGARVTLPYLDRSKRDCAIAKLKARLKGIRKLLHMYIYIHKLYIEIRFRLFKQVILMLRHQSIYVACACTHIATPAALNMNINARSPFRGDHFFDVDGLRDRSRRRPTQTHANARVKHKGHSSFDLMMKAPGVLAW